MNPKKDSKRIKQKRQQIFLSPAAKKFATENQLNPAELPDLSPYHPPIYGSNHSSRHYISLSNSELALIETPAPKTPKSFYIDQIDDESHQIQGFLSLDSPNQDGSENEEQDSQIMELSEEETQKSVPRITILNPEKSSEKVANHHLRTAQPKQKKQTTKKSSQPTVSNTKKVFCNCKKTKCLKLYCDCFRINQTCDGCNCVGCHNLPIYNQERNNSMMSLMDRNPQAFKPKIDDQQHAKGCHCKKSSCLKKYCQCYQAGLKCGSNCKCEECKNKSQEEDDHRGQGNNSMNSLIVNIENLLKQEDRAAIKINKIKKEKKLEEKSILA